MKRVLAILLHHNLGTIDYNKRGAVEYGISVEAVLWRTRIPQYIYCAKSLYGDAAELVIEDLLHQGQSLMSRLVDAVTNKLNEALESTGQYPYRAVLLYPCLDIRHQGFGSQFFYFEKKLKVNDYDHFMVILLTFLCKIK